MNASEYRLKVQQGTAITIQIFQKYEKLLAVMFAMLIMLFAEVYIDAERFVGDAYAYWHYSSSILDLSFPQTMRGYFYPLIIAGPRLIFETFPGVGFVSLYVMQALMFAFTLAIILPYVFTKLVGGQISLIRRLLPPLLVGIFFPGLIAYPLSDLPALCMVIAAIALILLASNQAKIRHSICLIFFAGILAYGAYNTRTIYIFTLLMLMLMLPMLAVKNATIAVRATLTTVFILGAAFASVPQVLINLKYLHSPTPLVVTDKNNSSLYASQLKWGVTIQRYETGYNAETGSIYPIYYLDPAGERVFKDHDMGGESVTVLGFLKVLASEPISFLMIYIRHFINGMDVRDDNPYTTISSKERDLRSIASLSISIFGFFLLVGLIVGSKASVTPRWRIMERAAWVFLMVLPVIAITPGAIETRFFLPVHLMAYCSIAFGLSKRGIRSIATKKLLLVVGMYLIIVSSFYLSAAKAIQHPVNEIPKEYFS